MIIICLIWISNYVFLHLRNTFISSIIFSSYSCNKGRIDEHNTSNINAFQNNLAVKIVFHFILWLNIKRRHFFFTSIWHIIDQNTIYYALYVCSQSKFPQKHKEKTWTVEKKTSAKSTKLCIMKVNFNKVTILSIYIEKNIFNSIHFCQHMALWRPRVCLQSEMYHIWTFDLDISIAETPHTGVPTHLHNHYWLVKKEVKRWNRKWPICIIHSLWTIGCMYL